MREQEVRVAWRPLQAFIKEVFTRVGLRPEDAEIEADALIWANLRGVDSHGVLRILWYIDNVEKGLINLNPKIRIINETPATLVIEADRAFGPIVTTFAMDQAIEKAKKTGIGWVFIRNHSHQGAMGYYSQIAAKKDMAGIAFVCSPSNVAPYGAKAAGVSNNPVTIAVPTKRHPILFLDMATSVAARGKIWLAVDKGIPMPEGWALDKDGHATTDPTQAAILLPIAGAKGSGLALLLECLCSIMIGNPLLEPDLMGRKVESRQQTSQLKGKDSHPDHITRHIQNSVMAAININMFTNVEEYKEHIDNLIDGIKALPKAGGFNEILVPGEPEERTCIERTERGIPLPEGTIKNLRIVADRFKVKLPL